MKKITLTFYECEHHGDLYNYKVDIVNCGGNVVDELLDEDSETGIVTFEVEDQDDFEEKFHKTESFEFVDV